MPTSVTVDRIYPQISSGIVYTPVTTVRIAASTFNNDISYQPPVFTGSLQPQWRKPLRVIGG